MKTNFYTILILSALLFLSCSKDKDDTLTETPRQNSCEHTENIEHKILYTECCVEGPLQAIPDEIITVSYTSNFTVERYKWEVLGGTMVLVEGENSPIATFRVGKNFIRDSIRGTGTSSEGVPSCSNIIVITRIND